MSFCRCTSVLCHVNHQVRTLQQAHFGAKHWHCQTSPHVRQHMPVKVVYLCAAWNSTDLPARYVFVLFFRWQKDPCQLVTTLRQPAALQGQLPSMLRASPRTPQPLQTRSCLLLHQMLHLSQQRRLSSSRYKRRWQEKHRRRQCQISHGGRSLASGKLPPK